MRDLCSNSTCRTGNNRPFSHITSCSLALLVKLIVLHPVKKSPPLCDTHSTIAAFRTAHHFSLSWLKSTQYTSPRRISLTSLLILSFLVRLYQGWQNHITCAQNGTRKDFLGTRHSLLSNISFPQDWLVASYKVKRWLLPDYIYNTLPTCSPPAIYKYSYR